MHSVSVKQPRSGQSAVIVIKGDVVQNAENINQALADCSDCEDVAVDLSQAGELGADFWSAVVHFARRKSVKPTLLHATPHHRRIAHMAMFDRILDFSTAA